jgi:hypothetical protein
MIRAKARVGAVLVCLAIAPVACTNSAQPTGANGSTGLSTIAPSIAGSTPPTGTLPAPPSGSPTTGGSTGQDDLGGKWSGTWADSMGGSTGALELDWRHEGSNLTGTISIDGWSCLIGGVVSGTLSGTKIEFMLRQRDTQVTYQGTIAGRTMSGTYSTNCDNTAGTWRVTKTG